MFIGRVGSLVVNDGGLFSTCTSASGVDTVMLLRALSANADRTRLVLVATTGRWTLGCSDPEPHSASGSGSSNPGRGKYSEASESDDTSTV